MLLSPALMGMDHIGGTELVYGESHTVEKSAGVLFVRSKTFLVGHTIFGCVDDILCGSYDTNHREDAKADQKKSLAVLVVQATAKA